MGPRPGSHWEGLRRKTRRRTPGDTERGASSSPSGSRGRWNESGQVGDRGTETKSAGSWKQFKAGADRHRHEIVRLQCEGTLLRYSMTARGPMCRRSDRRPWNLVRPGLRLPCNCPSADLTTGWFSFSVDLKSNTITEGSLLPSLRCISSQYFAKISDREVTSENRTTPPSFLKHYMDKSPGIHSSMNCSRTMVTRVC